MRRPRSQRGGSRGGRAYRISATLTDGSGAFAIAGIEGAFQYDGPAAADTWLAAGAPVDVRWGTFQSSPAGAGWVYLLGTVTGLTGPYPNVQMSLEELEAGASDCEIEPYGSVSLRVPVVLRRARQAATP